jgi:hypothetical protein
VSLQGEKAVSGALATWNLLWKGVVLAPKKIARRSCEDLRNPGGMWSVRERVFLLWHTEERGGCWP